MRCEQIQDLLSTYLDKKTDEKENKLIEAHLKNCFACRHEYEQLQKTIALLHGLEAKIAPDSFVREVHQRVAQENIKIFHSPELSTPKKHGWIAASVAGIALATGIFLSSFLPVGSMIVAWQGWTDKDNNKSSVSINDIIDRAREHIAIKDQEQAASAEKQVATANDNPTIQLNSGTSVGENAVDFETLPVVQETALNSDSVKMTQPRVAESYSTKIRVEDIGASVQNVYQLAEAEGADVVLRPSDSVIMEASSESKVKVVSLRVPEANVEHILNSLNGMGATIPARNTVTYTSKYGETEKQLALLEDQISVMEGQHELTAEESDQLTGLKKQQTTLQTQKQEMDQVLNRVTIEVRLVEQ